MSVRFDSIPKCLRWAGLFCLAAVFWLVAGCTSIDRLLYPTYTPLPTRTLYPTQPQTLTPTPLPTATATATPFLPAQLGTGLPVRTNRLDVENAGKIKLLASYGRGMPLAAAWSPDGRVLAVASTSGVDLMSAAGGMLPQKVEIGGAARSLAYFSDGSYLVVGNEKGQTLLVNPETLAVERIYGGQRFAVLSVAVSKDGRWLASAAWDRSIHVWDLEQDRLQVQIDSTAGVPQILFFDADRLFAWSPKDPLKSWSLPDGKAQPDRFVGLDARSRTGSSAAGAPGLFAVDQDTRVRVIRNADGVTRALLDRMPAPVNRVALFSNGNLLAALDEQNLRIWDLELRTQKASIPVPESVRSPGLLAISPDGRTAALVGEDVAFLALEGDPQVRIETAGFSTAPVRETIFSTDPSALTLLSGGALQKINLADGRLERFLLANHTSLLAAALSAGGDWVAAAYSDRSITVVNPSSGASIFNLRTQGQPAARLALAADGRWLAAAVGSDVQVWQTSDGKQVFRLPLQQQPSRLAFSPAGEVLAVEAGGELTLWNTDDWSKRRSFTGGRIVFSDGGRAAAAVYGDHQLQLQQFSLSGEGLDQEILLPAGISALSPDGRLTACAGLSLTLHQSVDGKKLFEAPLQNPYGRVIFSPDGSLLGYIAPDGTLQVWGVEQ